MKSAYLEMTAGVAGDMLLGAFIDAGVDPTDLQRALEPLGIDGLEIVAYPAEKMGVRAVQAEVRIRGRVEPHSEDEQPTIAHGRGWRSILQQLERSKLQPEVLALSMKVFERLGRAEAKAHNVALEEVHFHEVGADDALADIVGSVWAMRALGIERLRHSPFPLGEGGTIRCAHGTIPNPAPATLEILQGAPTRIIPVPSETVTPTGAALVRTLGTPDPDDSTTGSDKIGCGAGKKDFSKWGLANVVTLAQSP